MSRLQNLYHMEIEVITIKAEDFVSTYVEWFSNEEEV